MWQWNELIYKWNYLKLYVVNIKTCIVWLIFTEIA
jgi:hypothetical protein